jgi:hypothetical protein
MYEEKLRKPTLVTWRRYSTAQAGSAMSQMNAQIHPTSVRRVNSIFLLWWWARGGIAAGHEELA